MDAELGRRSANGAGVVAMLLAGLAFIALGLGCAALALLAPLAAALGPGIDRCSLVSAVVLHAVLAALLVGLGIGALSLRGWACRLGEVLAWLWVAGGAPAWVLLWVVRPALRAELAALGGLDPRGLVVVEVALLGLSGALLVILPAALIVLLRWSRSAAACQAAGRSASVAERCPRLLLSLAVLYALSAVVFLPNALCAAPTPLFGLVVSGVLAAAANLAAVVLCLALAWLTLAARPLAWPLGLAASGLATLSWLLTEWRYGACALFERLELPPETVRLLVAARLGDDLVLSALALATWLTFVAYLYAARRQLRLTPPRTSPR